MSHRHWSYSILIASAAGVVATTLWWPAREVSAAPAGQHVSTAGDQTGLSLTVYNSEIALVRDVRDIGLGRGPVELEFQDIAATVNPATVHFRSVSSPASLHVHEQNYEYDLLEPNQLLRKYVGREVTLIRRRIDGGVTQDEEVRARLLSYNNAPVWQIGNEIVTGLNADHIRFPQLPANLHARPTLIWSLENQGAERHQVEVSYLAGRLTWAADYVLTVGRDDRTADLDGWVTLKNESGTSFANAGLQFVAGELNRVRQVLDSTAAPLEALGQGRAAGRSLVQEAFSDYHLYTLGRKSTIQNNETKQLSMLSGVGFPVSKRYVVNGQPHYYRGALPGSTTKDVVQVFYQFKNEKKAGLGLPMPAGIVRVYQADSRGGLQFAGEDRIGHTPQDETLDLKIGHAFDVVAERKQVNFHRVSDRVVETEYEITVRNHKTSAVTVEINEPAGGDWQVLRSTHRWTKTAAFALQFHVPVAPDGEAKVRYRVRARY